MHWWRRASKDDPRDLVETMETSLAGYEKQEAANKLARLGTVPPDVMGRLIDMLTTRPSNVPIGTNDQPKYAAHALMGLLPKASSADRERAWKVFSKLPANPAGNSMDFIEKLGLIQHGFPDRMHEMLPRLRSLLSEANDGRGVATNPTTKRAIQAFMAEAAKKPSLIDQRLTFPDRNDTKAAWKALRNSIVPGTKLKLVPKSMPGSPFKSKEVVFATVVRVDFNPLRKKGGQEVINVPSIVAKFDDGNQVTLDPFGFMNPCQFDIYLAKEIEKLTLDEYKGHWVATDDPIMESFKDDEGKAVGILLKKNKDVCTLKMVKNETPWVIDVPCSTVKPTTLAPTWGREWFENGSKFSEGDVVEPLGNRLKAEHPGELFRVMQHSEGNIGIAPVGDHADPDAPNGFVYVKPDEIGYVGRLAPDGKVLKGPHFTSKAFAAPAPKQAPAVPQPQPQDLEA